MPEERRPRDDKIYDQIEQLKLDLAAVNLIQDGLSRKLRELEDQVIGSAGTPDTPEERRKKRRLWIVPGIAAAVGLGKSVDGRPGWAATSAAVLLAAVSIGAYAVIRDEPTPITSPPCCTRLLPPKVPIPVPVSPRKLHASPDDPGNSDTGVTVVRDVQPRETVVEDDQVDDSPPATPDDPPPGRREMAEKTCLVDTELGLVGARIKLSVCPPS